MTKNVSSSRKKKKQLLSAAASSRRTNPPSLCRGRGGGSPTTTKKQVGDESSSNHQQSDDTTTATTTNNVNKPRNLMVLDATTDLHFSFYGKFGLYSTITVHQSADEETWPGGAVWDLGWCMGQLLVGIANSHTHRRGFGSSTTTSTTRNKKNRTITTIMTTTTTGDPPHSLNRSIKVPPSCQALFAKNHQIKLILELGCGVGLTGLIAAAALPDVHATVLTDLKVVVDKVTQANVDLNNTPKQQQQRKGGGKILAMPLCWGNTDDEQRVRSVLETFDEARSTTCSKRKKKKKMQGEEEQDYVKEERTLSAEQRKLGTPDLIIIGDVAYQHRPGSPSHFDDLVSTLLQFVDVLTLVMFGTRIRMPASVDLLHMLLEHFDELAQISADEINPHDFVHIKHNMTIHILRLKKRPSVSQWPHEIVTPIC